MAAAGLRVTGDYWWLTAEGAWDVNKGVVVRQELMNTWCGCLVIIPLLVILLSSTAAVPLRQEEELQEHLQGCV